jgi:hypothetical protein
MNLSTNNVLVHQVNQTTRLIIADSGGSQCSELDFNAGAAPGTPFRPPRWSDVVLPTVDVFGLGVLMYIIATGHYPFHQGPTPQGEERYAYEDPTQARFELGEFSDLSDVQLGGIIAECCLRGQFETAADVVKALEAEMR